MADHITDLGEALGIELETQERESPVGSRSLDIMATDSSGRPVIIENQLTCSDGDHLGRLLIYAAGKDADVVIWVAEDFAQEHWQVLQWLNQRAGTQTKFFGVAVELWTIDSSRPAPYFRVVAAPNDWRKSNVTPRIPRKKYREFRKGIEEQLTLHPDLLFEPGDNHTNPWLAISHLNGLNYSVDFRDRIFFSFQLDTRGRGGQSLEWCHWAFDRLERARDTIESALGRLEWERRWQRNRGSTIVSYYPEKFSNVTDSWTEVHSWVIERYRQFREVFEPCREELLASPLSRAGQASTRSSKGSPLIIHCPAPEDSTQKRAPLVPTSPSRAHPGETEESDACLAMTDPTARSTGQALSRRQGISGTSRMGDEWESTGCDSPPQSVVALIDDSSMRSHT